MTSMLESISMFPFDSFWTIRGEKKVSHRCGGVLTLLSFLIIGAITFYQLLLVFQMRNVTTAVETQIDFAPAFANLTTDQDDPNIEPFMVALDVKNGPDGVPTAKDYYVYAQYAVRFYNSTEKSYQSIRTPIDLVNCTALHFSKLPNVTKNVANWGINTWYCLPLNQTYEIGGNQIESSKQIRFGIACKNNSNPACTNVSGMAMTTTLYTLNTFINPEDYDNPYLPFLNSRESIFQTATFTRNFIQIDRNILQTDSSLTPLSRIESRQSFQISNDYNTYAFNSATPLTQYFISRSGRTTKSYRSYLKLISALSFVGGLVAPIIAFFSLLFLTSNFGSLVFQMKFARNFFNDKVAKIADDIHYFRFIKQIFYKLLEKIGRKPDWQTIGRTNQVIKTVNTLMDVVYLHKRITFLERAMSIVLEKHQLKGLYLIQRATKEEADKNFLNHRLRVRINQLIASKQMNLALKNWLRERNQMKQFIYGALFKRKSQQSLQLSPQNKRSTQNLERKISNQNEMQLKYAQGRNSFKQVSIRIDSATNIASGGERLSQSKILDVQQEIQDIQNQFDKQEMEPIGSEEAEELIRDLSKLYAQAQRKGGDPKSKRIFEMLDKNMQSILKNLETDKFSDQK